MKNLRKIIFLIFICRCAAGANQYRRDNLVIENIPVIPTSLIKKLNDYQAVRYAYFLDWLPEDKGILISTRFGDVSQIHLVETPKGMRRQLTFFDEPVGGASVCPDYSKPYFLFSKDSAGNELYQLYKYNYVIGDYSILTDGVSKYGSYIWANKGDKFAFTTTKRNRRDFDIYVGNLNGEKSFKMVMQMEGMWSPWEWSHDDTKLLVHQYISANESHYYVLDLPTEKLKELNPTSQKISYGPVHWGKNDSGVFLISDQSGEFSQLIYYDIETGKQEILTKQIPWNIVDFDLSPSGDTIAFTTNEDGISKLYLMTLDPRKINQVTLPLGWIGGLKFKPDGSKLALVINRYCAPSDVYTLDFNKKTLFRWTYSEIAGLDTTKFIEPQLIHYETFDSVDGKPRLIPAFIYKPKRFKPPYPVLIECHGGPEGQYVPTFSPMFQYYLNELGIAIICPNVRGSAGYGKTFLTLDNGDKREAAVRDIGWLLTWLTKQADLDPMRVGIIGGSYGGYMVLASMVHYSDRLNCGIDAWGISNFITFLANTADYRKDLRRAEYGDERDPEMNIFLQKISPLTNAHKIKKPMFIIQGLNDPRVPASEAEQIIKAVRKNGIDVWYLLAEDEGHGFGKKPNRDYYNRAVVLFLEKYLLQ